MQTPDIGMPFLLETADIEAAAALCRDLGLSFVELNLTFPPCSVDRLQAAQLRALQAKYHVYFTFHLDEELAPCSFTAAVRAAWQESARRAIALARDAAVPSVNLHWPRGVYVTLPDRVEYLYDQYAEEYQQNTLSFRALCEEASAGQVQVCVENTEGFLPFQQRAIELLLASPCFGLTLDVGHEYNAHFADRDFYATHAQRLRHMHLHDANQKTCHLALGDGERDIAALLHRAAQAQARVVLEVKTVAALHRSMQYLHERGLA